MSKMHRYQVKVSDESNINQIKEALQEAGLKVTQELVTERGIWITGKDKLSAGEDFCNIPDHMDSSYIYFSEVKPLLEKYSEYIDEVEYYSENDTSCSSTTEEYKIKDGELVEK